MEIFQIIVIVFALFAISRVFLNIKSKNLHGIEALFWIVLWILVILSTLFPTYLSILSKLLGIERGIDAVVYVSLIVICYLIFRVYMKLENTNKKITKIIRTVAIKKAK